MKKNILKCYTLSLVAMMPFILLAGCNSGATGSINPSASQNNMITKTAMNDSSSTNAIIAHIKKLKDSSSIGINYTLDGEPLNTQTDNWSDMGWHLLTLTVSSAPPKQAPIPVQGVWATVGSPENPAIDGEMVTVQDINCVGVAFSQVGQTCSAYVKVSYDYTTYPTANPVVTVNLAPNNYDNLPIMIQPHDWIKPQTTVGIYRPIHSFEAQYYSGSTVKANPTQYRMLLMQNGSLESIGVNNLTSPSNPIFTALHRTTSANSDPIYGQWSECSLTANSSLNQVVNLPSLNSSCILVYQAASTSSAPTQTTNLTVGTNASSIFPYNATSFTLNATYSNDIINGITWNQATTTSVYDRANVAYGNGIFVEIVSHQFSGSSKSFYSTDGVTWNQATLPSGSWSSITYGNGKFVAIGSNPAPTGYVNVAAYSVDGINWNPITLPTSALWYSVTYGNGTFVATGSGPQNGITIPNTNASAYSYDGVNWNVVYNLQEYVWFTVSYAGNKFITFANYINGATIGEAYASDGINWSTPAAIPVPTISGSIQNVSYGNNTYVVVTEGPSGGYSSDGINWNTSTLPSNQTWSSVTYGNGLFVAVSEYSNIGAYSFDGIHWVQTTLPANAYSSNAITYGNGKFVAVGQEYPVYGTISISPGNLSTFTISAH